MDILYGSFHGFKNRFSRNSSRDKSKNSDQSKHHTLTKHKRSMSVSSLSTPLFGRGRRSKKTHDDSGVNSSADDSMAPLAIFNDIDIVAFCSTDNLLMEPARHRAPHYRRKNGAGGYSNVKPELLLPIRPSVSSSKDSGDDSPGSSSHDSRRSKHLFSSTPASSRFKMTATQMPLLNKSVTPEVKITPSSVVSRPNIFVCDDQESFVEGRARRPFVSSIIISDEQFLEAPVLTSSKNSSNKKNDNYSHKNRPRRSYSHQQVLETDWTLENQSFSTHYEEIVDHREITLDIDGNPIADNKQATTTENCYVSRATVIFSAPNSKKSSPNNGQPERRIETSFSERFCTLPPPLINEPPPADNTQITNTLRDSFVKWKESQHRQELVDQGSTFYNYNSQDVNSKVQSANISVDSNNSYEVFGQEVTPFVATPEQQRKRLYRRQQQQRGIGAGAVGNILRKSPSAWKSVSMQNLANRARAKQHAHEQTEQASRSPSPLTHHHRGGDDADRGGLHTSSDASADGKTACSSSSNAVSKQTGDIMMMGNKTTSGKRLQEQVCDDGGRQHGSQQQWPQKRRHERRSSWSSLLADVDLMAMDDDDDANNNNNDNDTLVVGVDRSPKIEASTTPASSPHTAEATPSSADALATSRSDSGSCNINSSNNVVAKKTASPPPSLITESFILRSCLKPSSLLADSRQHQYQLHHRSRPRSNTGSSQLSRPAPTMPNSTGTSVSASSGPCSSASSPFTSQRNSFNLGLHSNKANNNPKIDPHLLNSQPAPGHHVVVQYRSSKPQSAKTKKAFGYMANNPPAAICSCKQQQNGKTNANACNDDSAYLTPSWSTPLPLPVITKRVGFEKKMNGDKRHSVSSNESSSSTSAVSSTSATSSIPSSANTGSSSLLAGDHNDEPDIYQNFSQSRRRNHHRNCIHNGTSYEQQNTGQTLRLINNNKNCNNNNNNNNNNYQRSRMSVGSHQFIENGHTLQPADLHCNTIKQQQQMIKVDDSNVPPKIRSARINVIKEIVRSERNYAANLNNGLQTFVRPSERRVDLFDKSWTDRVFGQLERVTEFSAAFLAKLEASLRLSGGDGYSAPIPHAFLQMFGGNISSVGEIFYLSGNSKTTSLGLEIYSAFCISEPLSELEFISLTNTSDVHREFFEECRLQRHLMPVPFQSFLIAPVQRVCQYQLLLGELLKATPEDHPHRAETAAAASLMQRVATIINERRRQQESLERLALWQLAVDRWEGPNLLERSTRFIYSGALHQVKSNGRVAERDCFVFDHQLLFCKRTALRNLVFKGRIDLDNSRIVPLMDGTVNGQNVNGPVSNGIGNTVLRNAWRIDLFAERLPEIVRSITFKARTKEEKAEWMMALLKERKLLSTSHMNPCGESISFQSRQLAWQYAYRLFKEQAHQERNYTQKQRRTASAHYDSSNLPGIFGSARQQASAEASRRISAPPVQGNNNTSTVAFTPDTLSASLATMAANRANPPSESNGKNHSSGNGSKGGNNKRRSRSTIRAEDIVRVPGGARLMVNCVQTDV